MVEERNPYVGPKPFERDQQLFGRTRESLELRYLLTAERVVLLYSPSGAGKSSLVNAGLIRKLKEDFDVLGPTRVNAEAPAEAPNRYVWSAIEGVAGNSRFDPRLTLAEYMRGRKWESNPLIIFDQFEEILRVDPVSTGPKREFFEQVGEMLRDPSIWALFVLREDYLAPLDPYARLIPTHFQNRYRLDRLTRANAVEAIENPIRGRQEGFAPGAVEKLVQNLAKVKVAHVDGKIHDEDGDYVEPVQLQVVCFDLWTRMKAAGRTTIDADHVGEVKDALANYYSSCVSNAAKRDKNVDLAVERQIRNWFEDKLITADGVRNQVRQESDGTSGGLSKELVYKLVDTYLIRPEPRGTSIWYELAHDRMVEPVRASNKEWLETKIERFQKYAAQWSRENRPEGLLFVGGDLKQAQAWAAANPNLLSALDQEFLRESDRKQKALEREAEVARQLRQRLHFARAAALVALAAAVVAVAFMFYARKQQAAAELERQKAQSSMQTATAALSATEDPARALYIGWNVAKNVRPLPTGLPGMFATALSNGASYGLIRGDQGPVESVAWNPDGKTFASAGEDKTIAIFDAASSQKLRTLEGHKDVVNSVAWSPDGKVLASGSADQTVKLWDAASGQVTHTLNFHTAGVNSVIWSPDGKTMVSAGADGKIELWDAAAGQPVRTLESTGAVNSVAWSPDGTTLASATNDQIQFWNAADGQSTRTVQSSNGFVFAVAFSPDGQRLASAERDKAIELWDVSTGQVNRSLTGHTNAVYSMAWSPDGNTLASGGWDKTIRVWDVKSGLATATLRGHTDIVNSLAWRPDGKVLVSASVDEMLRLWDVTSGQTLATLQASDEDRQNAVAWSPNGKRIASGGWDNKVRLWDVETGKLLATGQDQNAVIYGLAWSPDGNTLASSSQDYKIRLIRPDGDQEPRVLETADGVLYGLAWSPDGKKVAGACAHSAVHVWDVASGRMERSFTGAKGVVQGVSWSRDGKMLAAAGQDKTIVLWDAATGQTLHTLRGHQGKVLAVAFSPDGKTLASGSSDDTVRLWDTRSGAALANLKGHTSNIWTVAWSPNGKTLVSGSADKTLIVWSVPPAVKDSARLRLLFGHQNVVQGIAWSPDGSKFASASLDKTVRIWPGNLDTLLAQVRESIRMFSLPDEDCQHVLAKPKCPPLP